MKFSLNSKSLIATSIRFVFNYLKSIKKKKSKRDRQKKCLTLYIKLVTLFCVIFFLVAQSQSLHNSIEYRNKSNYWKYVNRCTKKKIIKKYINACVWLSPSVIAIENKALECAQFVQFFFSNLWPWLPHLKLFPPNVEKSGFRFQSLPKTIQLQIPFLFHSFRICNTENLLTLRIIQTMNEMKMKELTEVKEVILF